jgi:lipopolysaccharide/colanic/teichoic acid biosynthesis glycosyltransferase
MIKSSATITLFDTELYLFRNRGLSVEQSFIKRTMDIVISLLILIILSPALIVVCIAIKAHDGGPIIHKQDRLTKDGRVFKILKFRSMRVDSEKDGAQLANKGDDRITPVGRVIRRLHVDELPQLINIIKGDMSFVGPRPERPDIACQYQESIPEFDFRLKMKAGLTGYAQVFGNYRTTPLDKLKLDLTYIENYSIWLDIMIIIQTIKIFFQKENSEGLDAGEKTALKRKEKI